MFLCSGLSECMHPYVCVARTATCMLPLSREKSGNGIATLLVLRCTAFRAVKDNTLAIIRLAMTFVTRQGVVLTYLLSLVIGRFRV